jgi:RNA polymerase sigma-70 factor, ECF subfamily
VSATSAMSNRAASFDPYRRLLGLAYRMHGSMADAEDAVQETHLCWHAAVVAAMRRASDIGRDHEDD